MSSTRDAKENYQGLVTWSSCSVAPKPVHADSVVRGAWSPEVSTWSMAVFTLIGRREVENIGEAPW